MVTIIKNHWCNWLGNIINGKHVITLYISLKWTSRGFSPHDDLSLRLIMYARKESVQDGAPPNRDNLIGQSSWDEPKISWLKTDTQDCLLACLLVLLTQTWTVRAAKRSPPLTSGWPSKELKHFVKLLTEETVRAWSHSKLKEKIQVNELLSRHLELTNHRRAFLKTRHTMPTRSPEDSQPGKRTNPEMR